MQSKTPDTPDLPGLSAIPQDPDAWTRGLEPYEAPTGLDAMLAATPAWAWAALGALALAAVYAAWRWARRKA